MRDNEWHNPKYALYEMGLFFRPDLDFLSRELMGQFEGVCKRSNSVMFRIPRHDYLALLDLIEEYTESPDIPITKVSDEGYYENDYKILNREYEDELGPLVRLR